MGKLFGFEEPNRTWFESNINHKLKLIKYSNGSKILISDPNWNILDNENILKKLYT